MNKIKTKTIEKIFTEKKAVSKAKPKAKKVVVAKKPVGLKKPARIAKPVVVANPVSKKIVTSKNKSITERKPVSNKRLLRIALVVAIVTVLGTSAGFFYKNYYQVATAKQVVAVNVNETVKPEAEVLQKTIDSFLELPMAEQPMLMTVTELESLQAQEFFVRAQMGDKVLTYPMNKKMILFRPANNKIIEIAAIPEAVPVEMISPAKTAIYNGARTKGLAGKIGDIIALIPGVTVSEKTNALGNYAKTTVIDLSGTHTELVKRIAASLNGEVSTILVNEMKPEADILVIGGSDFKVN